MTEYKHGEAFMLMTYRARVGTEEEVIWNSRDGVTPFIIHLRCGAEASHVDWHRDRRDPEFTPPIGSRIFIDLHPEKAAQYAEEKVERYWTDAVYPMRERYASKAEAVATLVDDMLFGTTPSGERIALNPPDLIEVTEDTLLWLKQGART
jgi:hypothetical protein